MSDEIFELKEMVRKLEAKNAELMEKNDNLEGKMAKLTEKNDKMKEENESLKAENSQLKNPPKTESTDAIQTSQPVEGEKPKSKRFFKNWLLFETLPWINRKELANSSMSTANETFRQLCWPKLHGNVKPHKIRSLKISAAHLELGKFRAMVHLRTGMGWRREEIIVPIASIPPLDYILGIERIQINFVNDEVVNFFKSIENLLQNCKLQMAILNKKRNASASSMRSLMDSLASKIYLLRIGWQPRQPNDLRLNEFNKIFPGFIDNVQFIQNWSSNPNIDEIDTILNWLTKQSKNGKQKLLEFRRHYDEKFMAIFISRINEEFSISNSPSNFLIAFECNENYEVFTHQENVRTNEILTIYRKNRDNGWGEHSNYYIIERYPKGEEHWKEDWENKIREYFRAENTSISINIDE